MIHVKQIKEIINSGKSEEAHEAIEQLLELGPSNIEALKMKAGLYEREGRFSEEEKVWNRIFEIDNKDRDGVDYLLRRHMEDKESFYYCDELENGGKRFIAYPKKSIQMSLFGIVGILSFFMLTLQGPKLFPVLGSPAFVLFTFFTMVLVPFVLITITYFKSLKYIDITREHLVISTRLKTFQILWEDIGSMELLTNREQNNPNLVLQIKASDNQFPTFELDMNSDSTPIRPRPLFLRELRRHFEEVSHRNCHIDEELSKKAMSF